MEVVTATEEVENTPNTDTSNDSIQKPFQRLQFLVRDWQNFDDEVEEQILQGTREDAERYHQLMASHYQQMQEYVKTVLKTRQFSDLMSTREQIDRCFEKLDCFLLPHPGTKKLNKK